MDYIRQHAVCHSVLESSCPPLHSSLFPRTSMAMQIANFFFPRFDIVLATSPTIMGPTGRGRLAVFSKSGLRHGALNTECIITTDPARK
jgi:hypothetical protein